MTGTVPIAEAGLAPSRGELRVSERFPCDVTASCQPPSDWKRGGKKWTARVRDVSSGGLCLVLDRRFERGAGLAIELPGQDPDSPSILLARVMNIRMDGDSWVLGCAFISPLSDEELAALTCTAADAMKPAETAAVPSATDVYFRGRLPDGEILERRIRKLNSDRAWPLRPGRLIELRFHGEQTVQARVDACRLAAGRWVLECTFAATPQ
ncbi:MAG TPA: PilZ domain-containing protein [Gemmataceae bacterium]|nr:PilZ domain-containing protein [Gemmataceae bacterium]